MPDQIAELTVLRAAVLMFASSILSDLRSMRHLQSMEEAQISINDMIDRVNALIDAVERAGEEGKRPGLSQN